ncbi:MAG: HAD family phosphatase [Aggregatilineales bacterium]
MPIRAVIFDLDGTLLKTEMLKAISYARAAVELCPYSLDEATVIEAFKDVVGLSRQEVAEKLVARFDLAEKAEARMAEFGVSTAWQAYVQLRLNIYDAMLEDPNVILNNQWAHNVDLLNFAREKTCITALATMSYREQVNKILNILGWQDKFTFIATRDDVEHGKPDPEIYALVSRQIGIPPERCLVIEDSAVGVQAAQAAGMHVIAVTTDFTRDQLHGMDSLDKRWLVDDPTTLMEVVELCFNAVR